MVQKPNDSPVSGSPQAIWPAAPPWPNARARSCDRSPRTAASPSSPAVTSPRVRLVGVRVIGSTNVLRTLPVASASTAGSQIVAGVVEDRLVVEREVGGAHHAAAAGHAERPVLGSVEQHERLVGDLGDGQLADAERRLERVGRRWLAADLEVDDAAPGRARGSRARGAGPAGSVTRCCTTSR